MNFKKILFLVLMSIIIPTFAMANTFQNRDQERIQAMDQALNCLSNAKKSGDVSWADVCYTSSDDESDIHSKRIKSKSMDQMIKDQQQAADELLTDEDSDDPHPRTVDDVAREYSDYADSVKSVDDVIQEQGIGEDEDEASVDDETLQNEEQANHDLGVQNRRPVKYELYASNKMTSTDDSAEDSQDDDYSEKNSEDDSQGDSYEKKESLRVQSVERITEPRASSSLMQRDERSNKLEVGLEYNRFRYEEPVFDLVDNGNLFGVYLNYSVRPQEGEFLYEDIIDVYMFEGRFNYGTVDYESSPSGTIKDIPDFALEGRILAGKDIGISDSFRLTPFFGFGGRYLNDDTSGKLSSTGASGYERESRYFYLPLGIDLTARMSDRLVLVPRFEFDFFLKGTQTSHLTDVNPGLPDIKNDQHNGHGLRGSVKMILQGNTFNWIVEPYMRYWHVADSDVRTATGTTFIVTGLEPENKTLEYGVRLGAEF